MNYYTSQIEKIGEGDAFAVQIENRSDDRPTVSANKWLSITPDQKNRIAAILAEGDDCYVIRVEDIGQPTIQAFGKTWQVADFIGKILPGDVGKRVYPRPTAAGESRYLTVESDDQRAARLGKTTSSQTERYINLPR